MPAAPVTAAAVRAPASCAPATPTQVTDEPVNHSPGTGPRARTRLRRSRSGVPGTSANPPDVKPVKVSTVRGVDTSTCSTRSPKPGKWRSTSASSPAPIRSLTSSYSAPRRNQGVPAHRSKNAASTNAATSAVGRVAVGSFRDGKDRKAPVALPATSSRVVRSETSWSKVSKSQWFSPAMPNSVGSRRSPR